MTEDKIIEYVESCKPSIFGLTEKYRSIDIEYVKSGESNIVYVVKINNTRFIIKVNGIALKEKEFFFNEYYKLNVLKDWNISPHPYFFDCIDEVPILAIEYIEGTPFTPTTLEKHIDGVINMLNYMSEIPIIYLSQFKCFRKEPGNCFDYAMMVINYAFVQLSNYKKRCGKNDFYIYIRDIIPRSLDYLKAAQGLFEDTSLGLIHTGLHPANLILSDNGLIKAIDWEHANLGDRAFEIAGLLRQVNLSEDMIAHIINNYNGSDKTLLERTRVYMQIFKLHECLWHAIRINMAENGEVHLGASKTPSYFSKRLKEKMAELYLAEYMT